MSYVCQPLRAAIGDIFFEDRVIGSILFIAWQVLGHQSLFVNLVVLGYHADGNSYCPDHRRAPITVFGDDESDPLLLSRLTPSLELLEPITHLKPNRRF